MEKEKENEAPIIQARKASPEAAEWHKFQREQQQKSPERIEDAAKFLAGMISISLTIFLQVDANAFNDWAGTGILNLAVGLWFLSLLAAFVVLFPEPYAYNKSSAEDIQRMIQVVTRFKYRCLLASVVCFMVALGLAGGIFLWG